MMNNILILYTELAAYNAPCFNLLAEKGFSLHVVRYPVNNEAPFDEFGFNTNINFYDRNKLTEREFLKLIATLNPVLVLCSGWSDKFYLKGLESLKNKNIPKLISLDNQWVGSIKQWLGCIYSRIYLKKLFTHCFVPGNLQANFAKKLGFSDCQILKGFYSADLDYFNKVFKDNYSAKKNKFPHKFIFVGRYYDFKGVNELWSAFEIFKSQTQNDWELWCLGTGSVSPYKHPAIKHFGFIQPRNLADYMAQCGVFILPSRFEPWGVVVHEFAAAGFPLICSDKVGAASSFLIDGENGFIFPSQNVAELKACMLKMIQMDEEELKKMGDKSHQLAQTISPEKWAQSLMSII